MHYTCISYRTYDFSDHMLDSVVRVFVRKAALRQQRDRDLVKVLVPGARGGGGRYQGVGGEGEERGGVEEGVELEI